eukprot:COSAG01_NODE_181_length_22873_cov_12.951392_19_plen_86_part_00
MMAAMPTPSTRGYSCAIGFIVYLSPTPFRHGGVTCRVCFLDLREMRLQILHQLRVIMRRVVALSRQPIVDVHCPRHVQRSVRAAP